MVLCLCVGCHMRSGRHKGISFSRVPAIITKQGELAEKLSIERRTQWVIALGRGALTESILQNDRVCGRHFVSGRAAPAWDRSNVDWVPTLNLGERRVKTNVDAQKVFAQHKRERTKRLKRRKSSEEQVTNKRICSHVDIDSAENINTEDMDKSSVDLQHSIRAQQQQQRQSKDTTKTEYREASTQTEMIEILQDLTMTVDSKDELILIYATRLLDALSS